MSIALNLHAFDTILVPRGAEYRAVCRGLKKVKSAPRVVTIPVGALPVRQYLSQLNFSPSRVLLLGLCGSLQPEIRAGDWVLYDGCLNGDRVLQNCDRALTQQLAETAGKPAIRVTGLTSDRVIATAAQKRALATAYNAAVVDMEGFAVLETLSAIGVRIAILRVVSDDCHGDIPDLSRIISSDGQLQPLPLALAFLKQPRAAQRLIRSSLQALQVLERLGG